MQNKSPINSIDEFININNNFWKTCKINNNGKIFLFITYYEESIVTLLEPILLAKRIQEEYGKKIKVYFYSKGSLSTKTLRKIAESFNINDIEIYCKNKKWLFYCAKSIFDSIKVFSKLKTKDDILKLKYKNIPIGLDVYDYIIRSNRETYTINRIKWRYFIDIFNYIKLFNMAEKSLSNNGYDTFVFHDCDYERSVFSKIAIKCNMDVFQTNQGFCIRHDYHDNLKLKISTNVVRKFYKDLKDKIDLNIVKAFLKRKYSGYEKGCFDCIAFSHEKKIYEKQELYNKYGIGDIENKNIFVMAHVFSDTPHCDEGIFSDYYEWLMDTISILKDVKGINVFVKEHPSACYYGEEGKIVNILKQTGLEQKNIYLLPEDFNTNSMFNIADCIITCRGTAGLEAVAAGIPVITAGKGIYSNYGIDIMSKDKLEYEYKLKNILNIKNVTKEMQENASILLYLQGLLYNRRTYSFLPNMRFLDQKISVHNQFKYVNEHLNSEIGLKDDYYRHLLENIIVFDKELFL